MKHKYKHPKVIETKLGRKRADGIMQYEENTIYIDERLKGEVKLETYNHEYFHFLFPDMTEEEVLDKSKRLTEFLWIHHVRFVENV